jgi:hypothetical protein
MENSSEKTIDDQELMLLQAYKLTDLLQKIEGHLRFFVILTWIGIAFTVLAFLASRS